ncbi:MAG: Rv2175c family DNA-binding protein [Actinomycetes bacterium]
MSEPLDNVADWISIPEAGERLGIVPGKVRRLIEEHNLIAVKRDGIFLIPAELIVNGEALPSLKGTILVLLDSGFSLMAAINWLYTENDVLRGTPMLALVSGRKTEVRRIAQSLAL